MSLNKVKNNFPTIDIDIIISNCINNFFSDGAMHFFSSSLSNVAALDKENNIAYFVTSERFSSTHDRVFSIRAAQDPYGKCEVYTVGEFGCYSNRNTAWNNVYLILRDGLPIELREA